MKNKITSDEIQKCYLNALANDLNPLEEKYMSAPKYVLKNKGLFKLGNDEYIQKHDKFIMNLIDNKKNLNPSRENSLELFIFAYCRFQEFIGWINKDEFNIFFNKIRKELKDKC